MMFKPSMQQALVSLSPDSWARPYFTALFDRSITSKEVLADLQNRPEVQAVEVLQTHETQGILGKLMEQMGSEYQIQTSDLAAFGVRVILKNKEVLGSAQELLNGIEETYGQDHVTTSGIRMPKVGNLLRNHPLFKYLVRFGYLGVVLPLMIVWFFSLALVFNDISKKAWLIERFQRRSFVRAKIMGAGFTFIVGVSLLAALAFQGPDLMAILLCLITFSIPWATMLREVKWQSQN
jgi:hypothetical protein